MNTFAQAKHMAMGTVMSYMAYGRHAEESLMAAKAEMLRLESLLSRFLPNSEVNRINKSAGINCERVSNDLFAVLAQGRKYSQLSQGLLDVTIGPLISLWAKENRKPPPGPIIRQLLQLVSYEDLELDPLNNTARLIRKCQAIDLGCIGKGYAGDKIVEVYKRSELSSAYANLGGNVVTVGTKVDGQPWHVGIQHPRKANKLIGSVSVADKAVITSGDYQRFFWGRDGKRYHHILDPFTGYPAQSDLLSVTIVADSSTAADALSTILFVAGKDKGLSILRSVSDAEAVLVDSDLQVFITSGLKGIFQTGAGIEVSLCG